MKSKSSKRLGSAQFLVQAMEPRLLFSTNSWKAAVSGNWDDKSKWSLGHVPSGTEDVAITVAGNYAVTVAGSDNAVNLTLAKQLTITGGGVLSISKNLNLTGTISLSDSEQLSTLFFDAGSTASIPVGAQTISGTGKILLQNSIGLDTDRIVSTAAPLTIGSMITVSGEGDLRAYSPVINKGTISVSVNQQEFSVSANITNQGTIAATNGGIISIGSLANKGTLSETASTINLFGTFTNAATIKATGGSINIEGTYDLAGKTFNLSSTTSMWHMTQGTLSNGTLIVTGTEAVLAGFLQNTSDVNDRGFSNMKLGSDVTLPPAYSLNLSGNFNLNGHTFTIDTVKNKGSSLLLGTDGNNGSPAADLSLVGPGKFVLGGVAPQNIIIYNFAATTDQTITIGANVTVEGAGEFNTKSTTAGKLLNNGVIIANVTGQSLKIDGGGAFSNHGTVKVISGSTLDFTTLGSMLTAGGLITGTGTIKGRVTNAGVIEAGSPLGTLTINGKFVQTATGSIKVNLGGTAATAYNKLVVTGQAVLAGILDVHLVNGFKPAIGNAFTVMTFGSKSGTLGTDGTSLGGGVALSLSVGSTSTALKAIVAPADTTPPTVSAFTAGTVSAGASTYTFTVTFADNVAIDVSTLGNSNVSISGPSGFKASAKFVSVNKTNNGTPRTATYSITAPGGTWDAADDGKYTITLKSSSVKDTHGNAVAAKMLGTFTVAIPQPV